MWTLPDSIVKSKFDNIEFTPLHCDNLSNGTLPLNVCTTPLECAHLHKVNQELNSRFGGNNSVGDSPWIDTPSRIGTPLVSARRCCLAATDTLALCYCYCYCCYNFMSTLQSALMLLLHTCHKPHNWLLNVTENSSSKPRYLLLWMLGERWENCSCCNSYCTAVDTVLILILYCCWYILRCCCTVLLLILISVPLTLLLFAECLSTTVWKHTSREAGDSTPLHWGNLYKISSKYAAQCCCCYCCWCCWW